MYCMYMCLFQGPRAMQLDSVDQSLHQKEMKAKTRADSYEKFHAKQNYTTYHESAIRDLLPSSDQAEQAEQAEQADDDDDDDISMSSYHPPSSSQYQQSQDDGMIHLSLPKIATRDCYPMWHKSPTTCGTHS